MCDKCNNCTQSCTKSLTIEQTNTNTQIIIPVAAKSDYELALESGAIPPGTTLEEWLNRTINNPVSNILEFGDNV